MESDFICSNYQSIDHAVFEWSAPSNIALVKYWGKKESETSNGSAQIPANPSISFTLSNCKTVTQLEVTKKSDLDLDSFSFDLLFEGLPKEDFKPKIQKFLERIESYCPYLKEYHLKIDTKNTFPHSSGIASSASGMAALAVTIMSLEKVIYPEISEEYFNQKASFLSRLGSGSACRSINGSVVVWGENKTFEKANDFYGVSFADIHENFHQFQDTILLVDKGEKQVSSTIGHNLMHNHPYATARFKQAHDNLEKMKAILNSGNLAEFIAVVESEALTLHAMMMTSMPYFILMKPNTLQIINAIWKFRQETSIPVCFTLDAGANVHVLYPNNVKNKVIDFIKNNLANYCENGHYICDEIGNGAKRLK